MGIGGVDTDSVLTNAYEKGIQNHVNMRRRGIMEHFGIKDAPMTEDARVCEVVLAGVLRQLRAEGLMEDHCDNEDTMQEEELLREMVLKDAPQWYTIFKEIGW